MRGVAQPGASSRAAAAPSLAARGVGRGRAQGKLCGAALPCSRAPGKERSKPGSSLRPVPPTPRCEKQLEQEEQALQQQRRRLYAEVAEEKERLSQQAAR